MDNGNGTALDMSDLQAQLARLQAENERLRAAKSGKITSIRVSTKGGVSVYGLGKWPVTLYADQWRLLLDKAPEILQFVTAALADGSIKFKGEE